MYEFKEQDAWDFARHVGIEVKSRGGNLDFMRWSSFFVTLTRKSFDIDHACILFSNGVIYPFDECGRI